MGFNFSTLGDPLETIEKRNFSIKIINTLSTNSGGGTFPNIP